MATSIKRKLRAPAAPKYDLQPVKAYTVRLPPEQGGGTVHVAAASSDAYRIIISGGQYPSSFAISKHDAGALAAILREIEGK